MSELTPNLKLFKYNTETDAKQPFSINDCMNANWDKLDASLGSLEIGDIGMSLYVDETKGKRRYLNGQIVDRNANTEAFFKRLQEITTLYPSLLCTEEEWQSAKTLSAFGQVGKFVFNYSGDKVVSVRIPRVVNIQGLFDLQNLGLMVEAGLPNITGTFQGTRNNEGAGESQFSGAFYGSAFSTSTTFSAISASSNTNSKKVFNASRSNAIYGNSDTVQSEAIQYPYFIQIATGSETENNIINDIELNNPHSFGDSKYSPIELNNISWLKSNGQWNAKALYPAYYDWILENVNNGTKDFVSTTMYAFSTETASATYYITTETPKIGQAAYTYWSEYRGVIESITETNITLSHINGKTYTLQRDSSADGDFAYSQDGDYNFVLNTADETFRLPVISDKRILIDKKVPNSSSTTWYNLYSDGWLEQHIPVDSITNTALTVTLLKPYKDAYYRVQITNSTTGTNTSVASFKAIYGNATTDTFQIVGNSSSTFGANCFVSGYTNIAPSDYKLNSLYYYVGETVQNANLIDAGRIGEILPTKTDKVQAARAGMPSNKYIDLTLGASGTEYTAPANGWIWLSLHSPSDSYSYIKAIGGHIQAGITEQRLVPVRKGENFKVGYGTIDTQDKFFRFYYAEGEV